MMALDEERSKVFVPLMASCWNVSAYGLIPFRALAGAYFTLARRSEDSPDLLRELGKAGREEPPESFNPLRSGPRLAKAVMARIDIVEGSSIFRLHSLCAALSLGFDASGNEPWERREGNGNCGISEEGSIAKAEAPPISMRKTLIASANLALFEQEEWCLTSACDMMWQTQCEFAGELQLPVRLFMQTWWRSCPDTECTSIFSSPIW
mmetsp:Transcript_4859/g.9629  ORF Transcript_4859/g.9629 Transcript_4859/m.9629 type:complete len:208 (+) Transcript_4859:434-1057(+)